MQSVFFKLLISWNSQLPSLTCASEKDVWQGLDAGIDFGKGSLNILKYVFTCLSMSAISPLETSQPSSWLVSVAQLRHLAPSLGPSPSFTLAIPDIQHVWILSVNGCQQTKSTLLLYSEVHSFIHLFHKCVLRTPA